MILAPLTALFTRSVMLRTRNPVVAWSRIGVGGLLFIFVYPSEGGFANSSAPGRDLLGQIVAAAAFVLAFAVLISCAASITEEKEQRTLGLLRMTGLNPFAVLFAKSTARLVEALVLMASTLPLALLAVTLGGVTVMQVLAVYVALATWLALVANLGLFWSVVCRTANAATGAGLATVVVVPIALLLLMELFGGVKGSCGWVVWLGTQSVFARLNEIFTVGYDGGLYAPSDGMHLAVALTLFLMSWLWFGGVRGAFGDEASGEAGPRPVVALAPGQRPTLSLLAAGRPRIAGAALAWKEFHFACGGRPGLVIWVTLPVLLTVILRMAENQGLADRHTWGWELGFITAIALIVRVGGCLSHLISAENRAGTLDDLVGLPFPPWSLYLAKAGGVAMAVAPLVIMCAVSWLLVVMENIANASAHDINEMAVMVGGLLLEVADFWLWCAALSLALPRGAFAVACLATVIANLAAGMVLAALFHNTPGDAIVFFWFCANGAVGVALASFTVARVHALGSR